MKTLRPSHLILSLFAACLCGVYVSPARAQDKTDSTAPAAEQTFSTKDAKITSTYAEAKNETTVEFKLLGIPTTQAQRVLLSVSASYEGRKLKQQPEDIVVVLSIVSTKSYRYPDAMQMQVTADGEKLPPVLMLNLVKRPLDEGYLETIATRMRYEIFKRLAQAKTVELKLHDLTLQLDQTQIARMRELELLLRP